MFIPRQPVVEDQFCEYTTTSGTAGVGGTIADAGAVVYLTGASANAEVKVFDNSLSSDKPVFGFLMQKVKMGYHQIHPAGYMLPGDLGSSDVIAQPQFSGNNVVGTQPAPVGVAHGGGIFDTTHYTSYNGTSYAAINAGDLMNVTYNSGGKITNYATSGNDADYKVHPNAKAPAVAGSSNAVAIVIVGVSAAKAESTAGGQTLYPIRIKLLV